MEAAKYCRQLIARTHQNGLRENIPSKFELSTLMSGLMNNSTIAVPLNTTVVFTNPQESEMKIEFDPCTMIHEVLMKVIDEKKCSPDSEFTLSASWCGEIHSDDVPEKFLFPIQKLCDVISQWTDVMASCPLCNKHIQPVFTFKKRLFFKKKKARLTNKEFTLLTHQFQQDVIKSIFPAERDTYVKLTALMAQMMCGDYKSHTDNIDTTIKDLLLNYLPSKMTTNYLQHTLDVMYIELKEQWKHLHQYKPLHCAMEHLKIGWKWPYFGSKLFHTQLLHNGTHLWLAVNEDGISEMENNSLAIKRVYPYHDILSFGQQGNCFKLVITQSNMLYYAESLLYIMSQLMIEEINGLTASYLERFLQVESDEEEST